MNKYADALEFNQQGIQKVVDSLNEISANMTKIKQDFIQYNETNLKPYWVTAGAEIAQNRLNQFINVDMEEFIKYINEKINNLQATISYANQIDNA